MGVTFGDLLLGNQLIRITQFTQIEVSEKTNFSSRTHPDGFALQPDQTWKFD